MLVEVRTRRALPVLAIILYSVVLFCVAGESAMIVLTTYINSWIPLKNGILIDWLDGFINPCICNMSTSAAMWLFGDRKVSMHKKNNVNAFWVKLTKVVNNITIITDSIRTQISFPQMLPDLLCFLYFLFLDLISKICSIFGVCSWALILSF